MSDIRVVLFDAGNVFVTFQERTEVYACIARIANALQIPAVRDLVAVKLLVDAHDGTHEGPYDRIDTGAISRHAIWSKFLRATGLSTAQMPEHRFWALFCRHLNPIPAVATILEELTAAGIPLVVVTNGDFGSQHAADLIAFHFKVRWTDVVVSSEIGCKKPDRTIFERAVAHVRWMVTDLRPENLLFVDDQARYCRAFETNYPGAFTICFNGSKQPADDLRHSLCELGLPIKRPPG